MDEFQSEQEQIEEIKQWWKKNGSFIMTGVILGVSVLAGWKYWGDYKERQASAASAQYEALTQAIAQNDRNGATDMLSQISADFASTPYSSQAALAMASFYVKSGEPELASEQLRFILDNSKDDYLKLVARLRLARVQLSQDRADDALATLGIADPGSFAPRYHEVRGDAYAMLDRAADARAEYQSALDMYEPGLLDQEMVEMKLSDLAEASDEISSGTAPAPDMMMPDDPSDSASETTPDAEAVPDA